MPKAPSEAITPKWVKDILKASGLGALKTLDPVAYESFVLYLVSTGKEIAEQVTNSDLYNAYNAALTQPVSPIALREAELLYQRQVMSITGNLLESELKKIGETIAGGLEAGMGPRGIARLLTEVQSLDANRAKSLLKIEEELREGGLYSESEISSILAQERERLLASRRETLARTESNIAVSNAREAEARGRGARYKVWITRGDNIVRAEHRANEAQGAIPIDEPFSNGMMRPGEPNCRCAMGYYVRDEDAAWADAYNKERAAALEELVARKE